jgi:DNA-directed RNA polymerase specialized sigma24 family protein
MIAATLGIPVERAKKISQRAIKKMQQWARSSGGSENGGVVRFWRPPTGVLCV